MDANSISVEPNFISDTDLHLISSFLNESGTPLSEVLEDIDGEVRDTLNPDIGADEFDAPDDDAGISALSHPNIPFSTGVQNVITTISNFGALELVSVNVYWEVNEVAQSTYNWSGSLPPNESIDVNIGSYDFLPSVTYNIKIWTEMPNGNPDGQMQNDTIYISDLEASLSGDYTIGGLTPDFNTFGDAVNLLNGIGVSDTVRFMVRSGVYEEQIEINEFIGSSCTIPVIFQSETGDSSDVILTYANAQTNYTVYLNGADGIEFQSMTLENTYATGNVLRLDNEANCNTIINCHLIGPVITTNTSGGDIVSSSAVTNDRDNTFTNSLFENGNRGMYMRGASSLEADTKVEGCTFLNNYTFGAYFNFQSNFTFINNEIITNSTNVGFRGLSLIYQRQGLEISANKVDAPTSLSGFYLSDTDGSLGNEGLISNNFIAVGGNSSSTAGIYNTGNSYLKFYHNNIHIYSNPLSNGIFLYNSNNLDVKNNNFVNSGGGAAIKHATISSTNTFDHNNLFTTGSILAYWNGAIEDLIAYQTISEQEVSSLSTDPLYTSNEDLHINKALLDGAGMTVVDVANDIDGELRMTPPDIGADEFVPMGNDAGLTYISIPLAPFSAGNYDVEVAVQNTGAALLTSASLKWEVNGVIQTDYSWTGSLMTGQKDTVIVGSYNFMPIVGHEIIAWVEGPNGGLDIDHSDDTLSVDNIYTSLDGNYTIGGVTPDFSLISDATYALVNGGIVDAVTFSIRSGIYNEAIDLDVFPGNDCTLPVTFKSETGDSSDVVIAFPAATIPSFSVLNLDGTDGMVFQNLTFENTSTTKSVVTIKNEANCNTFLNNHFIGANTTSSSANAAIYSPSSKDTSNIFISNLIENGSYAMYYYATNNSNTNAETGTLIQNNQAVNNYAGGFNIGNQNKPTFTGNSVTTNTSFTNFYGLYLYRSINGFTASNNEIINPNGGIGMYFNLAFGSIDNQGFISNNFVSVGGTSGGNGISLSGTYLKLYHNSINITATASFARALFIFSSNNVSILNNALVNKGGGLSFYNNSPSGILTSDYNDLFSSGPILGYWAGNRSTLTDWQTASGVDANSISVEPGYVSDTDLHLSYLGAQNKGVIVPEVMYDIDGDLRDVNFPNIGADEYLCPDILSIQNKVLPSVLTIRAGSVINLDNVTFPANCQITLITPELKIVNTTKVESLGILNYIQQDGCN